MDPARLGAAVRALRRRRGWRQADLGHAAGLAQTTISAIERGHLSKLSLAALQGVGEALGASISFDMRWRAGALDRLLDERHSGLVGRVVDELTRRGWQVGVEVSYAHYGERGSIDVLGWRAATRSLLVVEVKTDLTSVEAMLRKLDEKARLAPEIHSGASRPAQVSRLVVLAATPTLRRRSARHASVLDTALPARGAAVRAWLKRPAGELRGLLFLSDSAPGAVIHHRGGSERVRRSVGRAGRAQVSVRGVAGRVAGAANNG